MADVTIDLLKARFRQLHLPTMGGEFEKLARDAAATHQTFVEFLLSLTEMELAARDANAFATRIKQAGFPVLKDFDTYDFSALPGLSKPKVLELARGRMDRPEVQLLPGRRPGDGKDAPRHRVGPGGLSCGAAGGVLHGGGVGQPIGESPEAVHAGPVPAPIGQRTRC